jgi:hypothetical protein
VTLSEQAPAIHYPLTEAPQQPFFEDDPYDLRLNENADGYCSAKGVDIMLPLW